MYKTIDTLNALCVTLDGITAENYELNQSNLDCSEVHEQLADGEISLIMYLESTLGKPKGPFIKSLECALLAAEDVINTALKDANKEVFHDWWAVAALCRQWIDRIDGYYRYNPEPGTIAHALRKRMEELPTKQAQVESQARGKSSNETLADDRFSSRELQDIKDKFIEIGLIADGRWTGTTAEFECFVKLAGDLFGIRTKKGMLERKACASFVGFTGSLESARSSTCHEQQSPQAKQIRAICKEIHTKYVK